MAVLLLLGLTYSSASNLISDGGFEACTIDSIPTSGSFGCAWSFDAGTEGDNSYLFISSTSSYSGSKLCYVEQQNDRDGI